MNIKELQAHPVFKADRNRIYNDALNLAIFKSNSTDPASAYINGSPSLNGKAKFKIEPKIIEFRVHYVTNVR